MQTISPEGNVDLWRNWKMFYDDPQSAYEQAIAEVVKYAAWATQQKDVKDFDSPEPQGWKPAGKPVSDNPNTPFLLIRKNGLSLPIWADDYYEHPDWEHV